MNLSYEIAEKHSIFQKRTIDRRRTTEFPQSTPRVQRFGNIYKIEEKIWENDVFNIIKCIHRHDKVELIINFTSPTSFSLVTRNAQFP